MTGRTLRTLATAAALLTGAACGADSDDTAAAPSGRPAAASTSAAAYQPVIVAADFSTIIDNPFLPLVPGTRATYQAVTEDGVERVVVEVTGRTRVVMGVTCLVLRDVVTVDGEVVEDTLDWYAQHRDGTVWYFGEDTKELEDGKVVSTEGSWEAGIDGAQPGIVMPARAVVGQVYRQEHYAGVAEDRAEVIRTSGSVTVPYGRFDGVVTTKDTTPLEPDALEHKSYAPGVGLVLEVDVAGGGQRLELVSITRT